SQLADMDKEYAAKLEQVKAVEQKRADLKREQELREQTDQGMAKMAVQEKTRAKQIRDLKDQLQTTAKKNTALAKDLERQSQVAETPAVESKQERGEPENVTAPDKAKTTSAFLSAGSEANRHYKAGIQKWDAGDVDGAITEFKKTVSLDSSLAGAYYNIALGYVKKGDRDEACDYAYQAGEIYLKNKNNKQAIRMVVFIKNIDPSSSLIEKLRKQIAEK
ncbi:MAG: hypothetical protein ABIJ53_06805, partial [Verrucomicrobiota bacterium]